MIRSTFGSIHTYIGDSSQQREIAENPSFLGSFHPSTKGYEECAMLWFFRLNSRRSFDQKCENTIRGGISVLVSVRGIVLCRPSMCCGCAAFQPSQPRKPVVRPIRGRTNERATGVSNLADKSLSDRLKSLRYGSSWEAAMARWCEQGHGWLWCHLF